MRKLFILLFMLISCDIYASPYANPWLYNNMLDFINNLASYKDNFTNGIVNESNADIIVGAFIEDAYSVYKKEEEWTKNFILCGDNCYKYNNSSDILQAYNEFFYVFAIVLPISEILIKNIAINENITYYLKNKLISYTWLNKHHLIISIDKDKLEFKKQDNSVMIKTTLQIFKKYILN